MNAIPARFRAFRSAMRIALLVFCLGLALHATGSSFETPAMATSDAMELRGVLSVGGIARFRIYEATSRQAAWLAVGERGGDFAVVSYDPTVNGVIVERAGMRLILTLPKSATSSAAESDRSAEPTSAIVVPATTVSSPEDVAAESRRYGIVRH